LALSVTLAGAVVTGGVGQAGAAAGDLTLERLTAQQYLAPR